ncbi:hypothetical protein [Kingella oralis]|uniref:hypothetical protein n=1 Tax=Kingella oralis TaxID=505 RepID=UPI0034E595F7
MVGGAAIGSLKIEIHAKAKGSLKTEIRFSGCLYDAWRSSRLSIYVRPTNAISHTQKQPENKIPFSGCLNHDCPRD